MSTAMRDACGSRLTYCEPGGAVILLYHRVSDGSELRDGDITDAQLLSVSATHFAEHLDYLGREMTPMPLPAWRAAVAMGSVPPGAVIVTFDDGYADNLNVAAPLLRRYGVPASVFVATGYAESQRAFWWDAVERLLLRPGRLPEHLPPLAADMSGVELGRAAWYPPQQAALHATWNVTRTDDPCQRQSAYREYCARLRRLPPALRETWVDRLAALSGDAAPSEPRRPMSPDEVSRLSGDGLVHIGAHTHWHPVLSALPRSDQEAEIAASSQRVRAWTGQPPAAFSYPYGTRHDYTGETARLLQEAGFACGLANHAGVASGLSDAFALPRFVVRDVDADALGRMLHDAALGRPNGRR